MNLNYLAFLLISFIPMLLGWLWFSPKSRITKNRDLVVSLSNGKLLWLFIMSIAFVYGYMNLIIHQMGFYELFFTDIMKGSAEAQATVDKFLAEYGNKHRHLGHGVFHGAINAFVIALPFISVSLLVEGKNIKQLWYPFSYWLVTSIVVGGLISQFV